MDRPAYDALRVLVLAPVGQDGPLVCRLLSEHGIAGVECSDADHLASLVDEHAGAVLLTEEAADDYTIRRLAESLEDQSPWLDLPILLCATASRRGEWPPQMQRLRYLGNVTFLERPIRTAALSSAIKTALRSRQRQLRLKLLADMTDSLVAENDPEKLLADVWRTLREHLAVQGYLYHTADATAGLRLALYSGIPQEAVAQLECLEPGDWDRSASSGLRPSVCQAAGLGNAVSCTLLVGDERLGTLTFVMAPGRKSAPDEQAVLEAVCKHLALALMRSRTVSELQERADELVESARRKDEFLAMLGHELRNPLATLTMGIELIERMIPSPAGAEMPLAVVKKEIGHVSRLVDDLLDVSRITRGKIQLRKTLLNVNDVVADVIGKMRPQAEDRQHQLVIDLAGEELLANLDPTRIRQVVENLLANAIKYTDPGGRIAISTRGRGDELELRVDDTGIGLTAEMQPTVFDAFVQDGRGLDRSQGGLGVGLALVRRLVVMHGGSVRVFSKGPGRGSSFVVLLPLERCAAAAPRDGAAEQPERNHGVDLQHSLRVLLVEDIPSVGKLAKMLLEKLGHAVQWVDRGRKALPVCRTFQPHVAIVDIGLPDMDGHGVARQLRESFSEECPMLVALTGYGQHEDRRRALEAGFDEHLTKPADVEAFQRVLRLAAERQETQSG